MSHGRTYLARHKAPTALLSRSNAHGRPETPLGPPTHERAPQGPSRPRPPIGGLFRRCSTLGVACDLNECTLLSIALPGLESGKIFPILAADRTSPYNCLDSGLSDYPGVSSSSGVGPPSVNPAGEVAMLREKCPTCWTKPDQANGWTRTTFAGKTVHTTFLNGAVSRGWQSPTHPKRPRLAGSGMALRLVSCSDALLDPDTRPGISPEEPRRCCAQK